MPSFRTTTFPSLRCNLRIVGLHFQKISSTYRILISDIVVATHTVKGKSASADHTTWYATANDTSVLLVSEKGSFKGSYMTFDKSGYSSNLDDASFWGFNAAINVVRSLSSSVQYISLLASSANPDLLRPMPQLRSSIILMSLFTMALLGCMPTALGPWLTLPTPGCTPPDP
jgi:hypothetical protein